MNEIDMFRYDGKRVLIVGGATGMGAATARIASSLGAEVAVMDYAPIDYPAAQVIKVDLRDREAIDAALAQVSGPVHALFSAAGVAPDTPDLMKVNFIAHRHIIERLLGDGRIAAGGAICMVSSIAGLGWYAKVPTSLEFLATPDYESAVAWVDAHEGSDNYGFSKQVMNCYVAHNAFPLMAKGIRINAILPGPTDTPLARANADAWLGFGQDYRDAAGLPYMTAEQMANTMVFLNSDAASGISGATLVVDAGHVMSSSTGSFAPGKPLIDRIMGRTG